MKRNYEKNSLLIFMILIFMFFLLITISIYFKKNYRTYDVIESIVITDNYLKTYVDSKKLKKIKTGSKFYIDDKTYNYKTIEIEKNVMKKDNKKYHGIILETTIPRKYKDNDVVTISLLSNKKKIYKIFKKCWESD